MNNCRVIETGYEMERWVGEERGHRRRPVAYYYWWQPEKALKEFPEKITIKCKEGEARRGGRRGGRGRGGGEELEKKMARVSGIWFGSNEFRRRRVRPLVWRVRSWLRMGESESGILHTPLARLSFVLLTEK